MSYVGNTNTTQGFTPAVDYFSGNGSTVAFTLSRPVASTAQVQVVVNNVAQNPSDAFTVLNNTITFTSAPSTGTNNIYVQYTSPITQVIQPGQGTVTSASFAAGASEFASGTVMMFVQTSAPTGWTKNTSHDNKALRVVSGTAGTGGSVAFTTAFSSNRATSTETVTGSVGSTTLTEAQMPSHSHALNQSPYTGGGNQTAVGSNPVSYPSNANTNAAGGSQSHNHSLSMNSHFHGTNLAVQYVDAIIATKD